MTQHNGLAHTSKMIINQKMNHLNQVFQRNNVLNFLFSFSLALNLANYYYLDIVVTFLFICGIFSVLGLKGYKQKLDYFFFKPHIFNFLVLMFLASGIIGYVVSSPMGADQKNDILGLRWVLGFYAFYFAGKKAAEKNQLPTLNFYILILPIVFIIKNHWLQTAFKFFDPVVRLQGYYENPNHFALTLVLLWAYLIGQFAFPNASPDGKKTFDSLALRVVLFLLSAFLIATYSRTAWIAALASFFVATFYVKDKRFRTSSVAVAVAVSGTLLLAVNAFQIRDRLFYMFDFSATSAQNLRFLVWKVAWNIFSDHPFFGVGFSENARMFPAYYQKLGLSPDLVVGNSHNQYLEILSGSGIFGFFAYMGIFISGLTYFHNFLKRTESPSLKRTALSSILVIVALMVSSLTDTPFRLHECRNYLIVLLGYSFGFLNNFNYKNEING